MNQCPFCLRGERGGGSVPMGMGSPHAKQLWGGDGDQSTALQAGGVGKLEASNDKINLKESYRCVFPL